MSGGSKSCFLLYIGLQIFYFTKTIKDMDSPKKQQSKGLWKQVSGRVKEAWGALADDDLSRFEGRKDQLTGHIQEKTGEKRSEISKKLDELWDDKS